MAWTAAAMLTGVGTLIAADEPASMIPTYSVMGLVLGVLMWLMRRWAKQRDDALKAAQEAEDRERTRAALEIAKVEERHETMVAEMKSRHAAEILDMKTDMSAMRSVLSRVLAALVNEDTTPESKRRLYDQGMTRLFPGGDAGSK